MEVNWNIVIIVVGILIFCYMFRSPLSKLINKISEFNFKRRNKDKETEINFNTHKPEKDCNSIINQETIIVNEIEDSNSTFGYKDLYECLENRQFAEADKIFSQLLNKESEETAILDLERFYYYFSYFFKKDSDYKKIESLLSRTSDPDQKAKTLLRYGDLLFNEGNKKFAANKYEEALNIAMDELLRVEIITTKAEKQFETNEKKLEFLLSQYQNITKPNSNYKILNNIYHILEDSKDYRSKIFLEKAVSIMPSNTSYLFNTAYNHDDDLISLYYYNQLLNIMPNHATALNNIGVTYSNLKLDISSVEMYKKSLKQNESLPAANIAQKLLNAGFKDEALEYLNNEKKREVYHENVDHILSDLHRKIGLENEQKKDFKLNAEIRIAFMDKYAFFFLQDYNYKNVVNKKYISGGKNIYFISENSDIILEYSESSNVYRAAIKYKTAAVKLELTKKDSFWYVKNKIIWVAIDKLDTLIVLEKNENKYTETTFKEDNTTMTG